MFSASAGIFHEGKGGAALEGLESQPLLLCDMSGSVQFKCSPQLVALERKSARHVAGPFFITPSQWVHALYEYFYLLFREENPSLFYFFFKEK